jgi:proteasome lid subunit RPN8/RPN11
MIMDEALAEIHALGELRAPAEACGLLLPVPFGTRADGRPRTVIEMPNRAARPHDSYYFTTDDVKIEIGKWMAYQPPAVLKDIIIWHTHPGGGVGPSTDDIKQKQNGVTYAVVALTSDGPVAAMF